MDVTYLRQDFSAMLPVAEAHPWPEMQRFDFPVRERNVTEDEAAAYREKLTPEGSRHPVAVPQSGPVGTPRHHGQRHGADGRGVEEAPESFRD